LPWITTKGNYAAYRGGLIDRESRAVQPLEPSDSIIRAVSFARKPMDLQKEFG
jgi:hypothetical protein